VTSLFDERLAALPLRIEGYGEEDDEGA